MSLEDKHTEEKKVKRVENTEKRNVRHRGNCSIPTISVPGGNWQ